MSAREQISRRIPADQARTLVERYGSVKAAEDYVFDRLSNVTREVEEIYWTKTLQQLSALKEPS